ncbi:MAG: two-component regulator propeller domain-containing protein [Phycisphaerales bacterium]|nr:two-component regulator propeller domain-containing protein [Phycisphaerales bacterium]
MLYAQSQPIGQWRSHIPYNKVVSAATDGNKLYVAGQFSFYTYDILKNEISTYSKVNGMSDVEPIHTAHDNHTGYTLLIYNNSNIDLFKDETFYNIPQIKLKVMTGDKKIYNAYTENGYAYLSTGLGIIVVNLSKKEIKETYVFTKNKNSFSVKGMTGNGNYFYAATDNGLYSINKNNPAIAASASWKLIDSSRKFLYAVTALNKTFVATTDSVFEVKSDTTAFVFTRDKSTIKHLDLLENGLSISVFNTFKNYGTAYMLNAASTAIDSFISAYPMQAVQTLDKRVWIADFAWGLRTYNQSIIPNGPNDVGSYDILADNGKVYIAHGSYADNWNIADNPNGISIFENEQWTAYNRNNFTPFGKLTDAVRLAKDPRDQTLYIASQTQGLFYLKTNKTAGNYRETVFDPHLIDPYTYRLSGAAFDVDNNLWITQTDAAHELMALSSKDGKWYKFELPTTRPRPYWENGAAGVVIDDYNQKWFFSPNGGGVMIYNDKGTLENTSDDDYTKLLFGKGSGNLPDNVVQCIVNDKKGAIWIGTANGVGIVNCPDRVIQGQCETEIRVVQYDQFAGQLFTGENVKTIAVDGANRKWIGTGNGVWLISEDANKIIYRFTVDNSPLPSNAIQTIRVDPVTGDVYFGTDKGLVSYRSTATDGSESNKEVKIFPNPVRHGYTGPIAIKGLVENADVRITDISGQLIFRTKALGGQAIWNGTDYKGNRPETGVFLVFATNNLGTETFAGKLVFIK